MYKFLILFLAMALGSGCATYERMYGQYAAGMVASCGSGPSPLVQFTDSGGEPITVYQTDEPCQMAPPDNHMRIGADVAKSVAGNAIKGVIGFKALDVTGDVLTKGFDRAGDQVGGDGVIGDNNSDIFTDKTSEPTVVEPTVVEVGGDDEWRFTDTEEPDVPEGEE